MTDILSKAVPVKSSTKAITALFYGKSGTGKTTLAASFPKPALLIDIREQGTDSVVDVPDLDVLRLDSWKDFEAIYWSLEKVKGHKYKTVILDGMSQLQEMALEAAREEENKPDGFLSQRIWGIASSKLKTWIMNYRDLVNHGINVVFLGQYKLSGGGDDSADDEIEPSVGPALMPSVASTLTAAVNIVANTFIKAVTKISSKGVPTTTFRYSLRVGPHSQYLTKFRQPKGSYLPSTVNNATYEVLKELMAGKYSPKTK